MFHGNRRRVRILEGGREHGDAEPRRSAKTRDDGTVHRRGSLAECLLRIGLAAGAAALLFATGCGLPIGLLEGGSAPETGSLRLHLGASSGKTLVPGIDLEPATFMVSLSGPQARTVEARLSEPDCDIPGLAFGLWLIVATAYNAEEIPVAEAVSSVTIQEEAPQHVLMVLGPFEGTGEMSVEVIWSASVAALLNVEGVLTSPYGAETPLEFDTCEEGRAVSLTKELPTGYYTLTISLMDGGAVLMGASEAVRIVSGRITSGRFDFDESDSGAGTITIGLIPQMNHPIDVVLSGQKEEIALNEAMPLVAAAPSETIDVRYTWLLNGEVCQEGDRCIFGPGLPPGAYRADVLAWSPDGTRAGSTGFVFRVDGTRAWISLVWDASGESDPVGYMLYRGISSRAYDSIIDAGNVTHATVRDLEVGRVYYFAITAYNAEGEQSDFSEELIVRFDGSD